MKLGKGDGFFEVSERSKVLRKEYFCGGCHDVS